MCGRVLLRDNLQDGTSTNRLIWLRRSFELQESFYTQLDQFLLLPLSEKVNILARKFFLAQADMFHFWIRLVPFLAIAPLPLCALGATALALKGTLSVTAAAIYGLGVLVLLEGFAAAFGVGCHLSKALHCKLADFFIERSLNAATNNELAAVDEECLKRAHNSERKLAHLVSSYKEAPFPFFDPIPHLWYPQRKPGAKAIQKVAHYYEQKVLSRSLIEEEALFQLHKLLSSWCPDFLTASFTALPPKIFLNLLTQLPFQDLEDGLIMTQTRRGQQIPTLSIALSWKQNIDKWLQESFVTQALNNHFIMKEIKEEQTLFLLCFFKNFRIETAELSQNLLDRRFTSENRNYFSKIIRLYSKMLLEIREYSPSASSLKEEITALNQQQKRFFGLLEPS